MANLAEVFSDILEGRDWYEDIVCNIGKSEVLAQLAEEAGELSHAALKLRRVMEGKNPSPISESVAWKNLNEEIADVLVCIALIITEDNNIESIMHDKYFRWRERIFRTIEPKCSNTWSDEIQF